MGAMTRAPALLAAAAVALALAACGAPTESADGLPLPPVGEGFDYQLGRVYPTPNTVGVIARDATDDPDPAVYSICYVNGFQTQPGESAHWLTEHPELVLRDEKGQPVADPDWPDEYLLDTSDADKRDRIAALLGTVVASCATSGFDAVEIDNLDTYSRSDGRLSLADNIALAAAYVGVAHDLGMPVAQKNGAGHSEQLRGGAGFDLAVTEDCAAFDECADYTSVYGDLVFDIEYDPAMLEKACAEVRNVVVRDRGLAAPSSFEYEFQQCERDTF
jgi:hypothetical protein